MKNIQVIDGASNCVFDIFLASDEDFAQVFPAGTDIAFIDEVMARGDGAALQGVFERLWKSRIPKAEAMGIHGVLFYDLEDRKQYYPSRRDEEARNPDGSVLR